MTDVAMRVPTTDAACRAEAHVTGKLAVCAGSCGKMRLQTIAKLFVVSMVILTGSPALATQIAREQKADACHRTFGTCVPRESGAPRWAGGNTTHDDWPAGMILG